MWAGRRAAVPAVRRIGQEALVVLDHRSERVLLLPVPSSLPRRARRAALGRCASRRIASRSEWSSSRMSMATQTVRWRRDAGFGIRIDPEMRGFSGASPDPAPRSRIPDLDPGSALTVQVRGSSDGTSARCARSVMIVGRPAASARSHGPEISRAVGQRG